VQAQHRVIAQGSGPGEFFQHVAFLARNDSIAQFYGPLRGVALAIHRKDMAACGNCGDHHLIACQRAGLVGADNGD